MNSNIKPFICLILSILLFFPVFSAEAEKVKITKIKLFIDSCEYEWTASGMQSVNQPANPAIKPQTLTSWLSVRPELAAREAEIEKIILQDERRLLDSGYFYAASILLVPPRKNPGERTLIVRVSTGFLWRFGGGNAWGMAGKVGLGAERAAVYGFLGYNKTGLAYRHDFVGGSPFALGAELFYYGPGDFAAKTEGTEIANRFAASLTTGVYVHPDVLIGIDSTVGSFGFSSKGIVSFEPFISWNKYLLFNKMSSLGGELRFSWFPQYLGYTYQAASYIHLGFLEKFCLALKASAGYTPQRFELKCDLPASAAFDLYYTDDRNVRSGYARDNLRSLGFILASAELRYKIAAFILPPALNCTIQTFCFYDAAFLDRSLTSTVFADAAGLGLRVLFDNPIFAYFSFSYGWNHRGSGRFIFSATAGY